MGVNGVAALWGFAEATLFFFVPDVWVSFVAARRLREALTACLFAVGGALIGGVVMYVWGASDPATAVALLDRVPAISPGMIERVGSDLAGGWPSALFVGAFIGTPYKIYAVQAGAAGIGLLPFLLVSVPARLVRFALVALVVAGLFRGPFRSWSDRARLWGLVAFWVVFYGLFLGLMPS